MAQTAVRRLVLGARSLALVGRQRFHSSVDPAVRHVQQPQQRRPPLLLYTAATPNGRKVSALLEELRATTGLQYAYVHVHVHVLGPWVPPPSKHVCFFPRKLRFFFAVYSVHKIDLSENTQKEPWFLKLNPNGRIPVLVDHSRADFTVFETAAILLYLARYYDTHRVFAFDPVQQPEEYSQMVQWIFWAVRLHLRLRVFFGF